MSLAKVWVNPSKEELHLFKFNYVEGEERLGLTGQNTRINAENFVHTDEEEKELFLQGLDRCKGDESEQSNAKKKTRYVYRTSEQVVDEAAKGDYSDLSKVKVVDMTGHEQRVFGNYSALAAKKASEPVDEKSANYAGKDKVVLRVVLAGAEGWSVVVRHVAAGYGPGR